MADRQFQLHVIQTSFFHPPWNGTSWFIEAENGTWSGLWFMQWQLFGHIDADQYGFGKLHFRVYTDPDFQVDDPGLDYWGELRGGDPDHPGVRAEGRYGHVPDPPSADAIPPRAMMVLGSWSGIGRQIA